MEKTYIILAFILINSFYIIFMYSKVKSNVSKSVMEEIKNCPDKILIHPEVASVRGIMDDKKIKYDGIVYMTSKKIIFNHLYKKIHFEINIPEINKISEEKTFMDSGRKNKNVLVLELKSGNKVGIFVDDNKIWEHKIKKAKKAK